VLSQAHAAASTARRSRLLRWSGPLALAASVVVVVSLVLEPSMQQEISQSAAPALNKSIDAAVGESPPVEIAMPQSTDTGVSAAAERRRSESQPQQAASLMAESETSLGALADEAEYKATAQAEQSRERGANAVRRAAEPPSAASEMPVQSTPTTAIRQTTNIAPPAAPMPAPAPAADAAGGTVASERGDASLEEIVMTAESRRQQANDAAGPRGTVSMSRARQETEQDASDKNANDKVEQTNPAAWLERIRELRRVGRNEAADREWQRFAKQYPDYTVDAADLARPTPR
jgi:hypothetical protein